MDAICPSAIDSLVQIWSALHKELDVEIEAAEARYLSGVVLGMDDELVARLLAAKISMSRAPDANCDGTLVRRGSVLEYAIQGRTRGATLVHGSVVSDGRLGVGTRFGAAVIGLRPGQSLLWPMEQGRLAEVRVLEVMTTAIRKRRAGSAISAVKAKPCAFG